MTQVLLSMGTLRVIMSHPTSLQMGSNHFLAIVTFYTLCWYPCWSICPSLQTAATLTPWLSSDFSLISAFRLAEGPPADSPWFLVPLDLPNRFWLLGPLAAFHFIILYFLFFFFLLNILMLIIEWDNNTPRNQAEMRPVTGQVWLVTLLFVL